MIHSCCISSPLCFQFPRTQSRRVFFLLLLLHLLLLLVVVSVVLGRRAGSGIARRAGGHHPRRRGWRGAAARDRTEEVDEPGGSLQSRAYIRTRRERDRCMEGEHARTKARVEVTGGRRELAWLQSRKREREREREKRVGKRIFLRTGRRIDVDKGG
jgi:hypothetical protein